MSGRRWLVASLALTPVFFIPTCAATRAAFMAAWKRPVNGAITTTFPVLVITGGRPDIVAYASGTWRSGQLLAPDPKLAEKLVSRLKQTQLEPDPDRSMKTSARIESSNPALQRFYVGVHREMGLGDGWSESWYETDGRRLVPLYEREYAPSFAILISMIVALPISMALAAACAKAAPPGLMSRSPEPRHTRLFVVFALCALAAWQLDQDSSSAMRRIATPAGWLAFWMAVGWIAWFPAWRTRSRIAATCVVVAAGTAGFMLDQPAESGGALIVAGALAVLVAIVIAAATLVERSLSTALRQLQAQHQT